MSAGRVKYILSEPRVQKHWLNGDETCRIDVLRVGPSGDRRVVKTVSARRSHSLLDCAATHAITRGNAAIERLYKDAAIDAARKEPT